MIKLGFYKHCSDEELIKMAEWYIDNESTVRETGNKFEVPKSTVHHMFTNRLKRIDKSLYNSVLELLEENKIIRTKRATLASVESRKKNKNKNDNKLCNRR